MIRALEIFTVISGLCARWTRHVSHINSNTTTIHRGRRPIPGIICHTKYDARYNRGIPFFGKNGFLNDGGSLTLKIVGNRGVEVYLLLAKMVSE